jgi:hypothetical protein
MPRLPVFLMKRSLFVLLFVPALLLALACDGNGGGTPSVDETPAGETAPSADVTSAAGETPTEDAAGDDIGELTLEEYFQGYVAIQEDFQERSVALEDPTEREFDSFEEEREAYRAWGAALVEVAKEVENRVSDLSPPPEVEDFHNQYVASMMEFTEVTEELFSQIERAEADSELLGLFEAGGAGASVG